MNAQSIRSRNILLKLQLTTLLIIVLVLIFNFYTLSNKEIIQSNNVMVLQKSNIENDYFYNIELINKKINVLSPNLKPPKKLSEAIYLSSKKYEIPQDILISLIFIESSFRKYVKSHKNCIGYMQLNYRVHNWIDSDKMYDTYYNIDAGSRILKKYHDREKDWERALIRYNGWISNSRFGRHVLYVSKKLENININ